MTIRDAIGFSLVAGIALGLEIALVSAVRAPLILTWPAALIGAWLNARAARKTLRLLHATACWAHWPDASERWPELRA